MKEKKNNQSITGQNESRCNRPYKTIHDLKNDDYREGDTVKLIEFAEGRATGNTADMKIICMDDDTTSSALEEGYCVIALQEV